MRTTDEHPLLMSDLAVARRYFEHVGIRSFVLCSLAAAIFYNTALFRPVWRVLDLLDRMVFLVPFARRFAWTSIWLLGGPRKEVPGVR